MSDSGSGRPGLRDELFEESLQARRRIYELGQPTPLDVVELGQGGRLLLKREDVSRMHAYKWRGAINKISKLHSQGSIGRLVAASAGNHAQGVALGASGFGLDATIFMPLPTPLMKSNAVRRLGGDHVEVRLVGDTFDAALQEARAFANRQDATFIHPFDDIDIMAGQATIADEVVMSGCGKIERAYLQIGGGGMAAGVANWLRRFFPDIRIVGVEGEHQASMTLAVERGRPEPIPYLDVFCDGTAVRQAGELTWQLCRDLVDEFVTVTNSQVCAAIEFLWERRRIIPEPAGAMGVAAWLTEGGPQDTGTSLCIVCGSNMDFARLSQIVRQAATGSRTRRYVRFQIAEKAGSLSRLIGGMRKRVNIIEFQYGLTDPETAYPVIGFDAVPSEWASLREEWNRTGQGFEDVTGHPEVNARFIACDRQAIRDALFLEVEFPERAGALSDFLLRAGDPGSICYFNYEYTGERVGRALLGLLFPTAASRAQFLDRLRTDCKPLRSAKAVEIFHG